MLILLAMIAAALFLGPALRGAPGVEPQTQLPAMTNVPPAGALHFETAAEPSAGTPPSEP
jgi:hypothetical protein